MVKVENKELGAAKSTLQDQISLTTGALNQIIQNPQSSEEMNAHRKKTLNDVVEKVGKYSASLSASVLGGKSLPEEVELKVDVSPLSDLGEVCKEDLEAIQKKRKKDPILDAYLKISIASHAYAQVRDLKAEQAAYETQRDAMDEISTRFIKAQKDALTSFLDSYSNKIDESYQFLNPGERFENIAIVPVEKDGELV